MDLCCMHNHLKHYLALQGELQESDSQAVQAGGGGWHRVKGAPCSSVCCTSN